MLSRSHLLAVLLLAVLLLGGRSASCQYLTQPSAPATNALYFTNIVATTGAPLTNVTAWFPVGSVYLPVINAHITDGGITPNGTNTSLTVNEQLSLDGVNAFTIATWQPGMTNPIYAPFPPATNNGPQLYTIYVRFTYNATNNVPLGINVP